MEKNPFGGVCGLVCPDWFCMSGCVKNEWDRSLDIPSIQATIIDKAYELGVFPQFKKEKPNGEKIAVIGAGPAGLTAAAILAQKGYSVEVFEKDKVAGGTCNLIPDFRLPHNVLNRDIDFILSLGDIKIKTETEINDIGKLLQDGYKAIIVAVGLQEPVRMGINNEELTVPGIHYLKEPNKFSVKNETVAIIGGGAVAADCAVVAKRKGAKRVIMFALEKMSEMPLAEKERNELIQEGIEIEGRIRVSEIIAKGNKIKGIKTVKVKLKGDKFSLKNLSDVNNSEIVNDEITKVISAIGTRGKFNKIDHNNVFYAGDFINGPTTVVEAVASGKNVAHQVLAFLKDEKYKIENPVKSFEIIDGYNHFPISLETDFFGRRIETPFLLSAAPPSDGYDQMKKAYESGWSGGVMKTVFDNVPIHIPSEYMYVFNNKTYANCDNVSGHPLDRTASEAEKLVKEYPDRLTIVSTGGPVTGNDEEDKKVWQRNTANLKVRAVWG